MVHRNSNNVTDLYGDKIVPMLQQHIVVSRCILDGELLVWDSITEQFEEFGKLKTFGTYNSNIISIAISGKDASYDDTLHGTGSNLGKQLCCIPE